MTRPKLPQTWPIAREGVNAARVFFEANGCPFDEVPQQNDFGKDAYVDVVQDGTVTNLCVALQIKSGESFRTSDGDYVIPVDHHATNWRESTVPVFGIVYDRADQRLRWVDLTGYLRLHPDQNAGSVPVSRADVLNARTLQYAFGGTAARYAVVEGAGVALNLLSGDAVRAHAAVYDAWALGRHDPRYLVLLRRTILDLPPEALRKAIWLLSHVGSHPGIFWGPHNRIEENIARVAARSFRWSSEEVAYMIRHVDISDWGRGTLGECVDVLLYEDPQRVAKLRAAVELLFNSAEMELAIRAITLVLSHSKEAPQELERVAASHPDLVGDEWFDGIAAMVRQDGYFDFY